MTMDNMSQARSRLVLRHVFYTCLALNTRFIADKSVPTAGTDMKCIRYNPEWVGTLTVAQTIGLVVHELLHIMFKHGLRRGNRDPKRWNIACDHAINLLILASGIELPPNGYHDKVYGGMSTEQIYLLLPESSGEMGGIGQDLREPGLPDEASRRELEQHIDIITTQAVTQAMMAGDLPAHIMRAVQGVLHPPIRWEHLLADFMRKFAKDEESWSRRNRRYSHVYMPDRHSVTIGEFTVICDTSGSMPDAVFPQLGVELMHVHESVHPSLIRVIWADAEDCSAQQVFERDDIIDLKPEGGGGTDMRLPLRYIEQFEPCVGILVTDGYTPWPTQPTPYPLIIVCTTTVECPSWAHTVRVNV